MPLPREAALSRRLPAIISRKVASTSVSLLRLHRGDNVLTVITPLRADDEVSIDGNAQKIPQPLPIGHKVAARAIAAGEKIIKYGVPIGSAKRDIAAGEHVHTHNVQ